VTRGSLSRRQQRFAALFTNPSWLLSKMHRRTAFSERFVMSIFMSGDTAAALSTDTAETDSEKRPIIIGEFGEMALTVMFTLAAVLFVSFLAVVTGLV
jgi:hypothetical protein